MKYSNDERINEAVETLVALGWTTSRTGKHPKLVSPDGKSICYFKTPSDHRSFLNWRSRLRKMGAAV